MRTLWGIICFCFTVTLAAQQPGSGYALKFNGGSHNYADCGDVTLDTNDFTIELWMNLSSLPSNNGIMGTWASGWPPYFYLVYGFPSANDLTMAFHYSGSTNTYATWNTTALLGWHHIAVSFARNGNMILYVDGIQRASASISFAHGKSLDYLPSSLQLGSIGSNTFYFNGSLDEIRVWKKVRTQQEIRDNMCKKLKGTETGLIGYWILDEGSGTTINDHSPSGYNGSLH